MRLGDSARAAERGLSRHPVRASLSMTGIVAGVAAVVLLVGVAQAVGAVSNATVEGVSPDLVVVYPGGVSSSGVQVGINTGDAITSDDVTALGNPGYVPDGIQAVPTVGLRDSVQAAARTWQTDVIGSTAGFPAARGYAITSGRFFSAADVGSIAAVVVLGETVAQYLYPGVDPVGQIVTINRHPFTVVGVFAQRGYSGTYNEDDLAVVPITSAWAHVLPQGVSRIQQVLVQAKSPSSTAQVKTEVVNTLLRRHHIINPTLADFQVRTQQDLVGTAERIGTVMSWTLGTLAFVALLTGTICIMGLMLERVAERKREIGISRVVGAARGDIVVQILVEALLLASIGGAIGIALGAAATSLTADLMSDLPAPTVTNTAIVIGAVIAILVGSAAGVYPAMRASRVAPEGVGT